ILGRCSGGDSLPRRRPCEGKSSYQCRLTFSLKNVALGDESWSYAASHMKILRVLALAVAAGLCIAADPAWNPDNAVKEADRDIRTGHIKFYWSGSIASFPVGVPFEVVKKYPKADAGNGC